MQPEPNLLPGTDINHDEVMDEKANRYVITGARNRTYIHVIILYAY